MGSIILEAQSLTKEYKHTMALDHINLQIEKGKIYGFIGKNGAGKTTFLRLITGLAFPTSGTLTMWGKSGTAMGQIRLISLQQWIYTHMCWEMKKRRKCF